MRASYVRYAVIITRHSTHSEQPAAAVDGGDQDAHTTRGRPPPEPERRSTAALRSVGEHLRRVLPDAPRRPQEGSRQDELANHPQREWGLSLATNGDFYLAIDNYVAVGTAIRAGCRPA